MPPCRAAQAGPVQKRGAYHGSARAAKAERWRLHCIRIYSINAGVSAGGGMADQDSSGTSGVLSATRDPDMFEGVWGPEDSRLVKAFKRDHPDWIAIPAELAAPPAPATVARMARLRPRGPIASTPTPDLDNRATSLIAPVSFRVPDAFPSPSTADMPSAAEFLAALRQARRGGAPDEPPAELIPVQRRRGGRGPTRLPGGGFGDLTTAQEFLLFRYQDAQRSLEQLEPQNPLATTLRPPNTPPSRLEVEELEAESHAARLRRQLGEPPRTLLSSPSPRYLRFRDWDDPLTEQERIEAEESGRTEKEYHDLARDPAHAGGITAKTQRERSIGLDLERQGVLPGPITRDSRPRGGEFVDSTGQAWDVKGFNSYVPTSRGGYTLRQSIEDIEEEIREGENVILDTSKLLPADVAELRAEIEARGLASHVRWWP